MKLPKAPARKASEVRDLAKRARRWADSLSRSDDRDRLIAHAEDLERQAAELDAADAPPPQPERPARQPAQQQQQRQPQAKPDKPKPDNE
jgi:hypothetical protein